MNRVVEKERGKEWERKRVLSQHPRTKLGWCWCWCVCFCISPIVFAFPILVPPLQILKTFKIFPESNNFILPNFRFVKLVPLFSRKPKFIGLVFVKHKQNFYLFRIIRTSKAKWFSFFWIIPHSFVISLVCFCYASPSYLFHIF